MTNEASNRGGGGGINRWNFLKNAGVGVAGGTFGTELTLTPERARAAETAPTTITNICCCGTYPRHATAIMETADVMKGA